MPSSGLPLAHNLETRRGLGSDKQAVRNWVDDARSEIAGGSPGHGGRQVDRYLYHLARREEVAMSYGAEHLYVTSSVQWPIWPREI